MKIEKIFHLLAAILKSRPGQLGAQPSGIQLNSLNLARTQKLSEQKVQELNGTLGSLQSNATLNEGWHESSHNDHSTSHISMEGKFRLLSQGMLNDAGMLQNSRLWEADYVNTNRQDHHPDNCFKEGMAENGSYLFSSADFVARSFRPSEEDARLALLISQHVKHVSTAESKTSGTETISIHSMAIYIFIVVGCAVLVLVSIA